MDYRLVLTTCPNKDTAEAIAAALVQGRLAACVSILPGARSVYEWKGEVETEEEQLLLIKTRQDKYNELERAILDGHPYELPEIIAVPIEDGLGAYLSWIDGLLDKAKE
jgi:periplasmic divalent cation tolerance protein